MLDIKIDTFLKVVELRSYTAAAQALHLTQPAVTQHIRKLEEYYGCQLIDSTRHSVRLTRAGEMLYQQMSSQQANEKQFIDMLHSSTQPLRIGATLSIADYYLPDYLTPELLMGTEKFSILVENSGHILQQLQQGRLDCAWIEGIFDKNLFEAKIFKIADFVPVVSVSHPLARREVELQDLFSYPLALRETGSGTRELLESYLYQHNATIQSFPRVIELGSFALLKHMTAHTDAVSFVYEGVVRNEIQHDILCTPLMKDYHFTHPLHFIYRKGSAMGKRYEAFYDMLCRTQDS